MSRIESILLKARFPLADKDADRWTDSDLRLLLSEAQQDIAMHAELFEGRQDVALTIGEPYFDLPEDCWMITRILYAGRLLKLVSHSQLDALDISYRFRDFDIQTSQYWETDTGLPEAILYDKRNMQEGKVYPIPNDEVADVYTFTIDSVVGNTPIGVTTSIDDYTQTSHFGVVTSLFESGIDENLGSEFGVVTSINEERFDMRIYYVKVPPELTEDPTDTELIVPMIYDKALRYYIVGQAFATDIDEYSREKSGEFMLLYQRELEAITAASERSSTRGANFETDYRRTV